MINKIRKKEIKSNAITVKYSDSEQQLLHKNLSEFNSNLETKIELRPYIRMLSLKKRLIKPNKRSKVDNEMVRNILMIGNNINQIARAINSGVINDSGLIKEELQEFTKIIKSINREISQTDDR
jgi:hypothetical protein